MAHFTASLEEVESGLKHAFQTIQNLEEESSPLGEKHLALYRELEDSRLARTGRYSSNKDLVETESLFIYYPEEREFAVGINHSSFDPERYDGKVVSIPENIYQEAQNLIDEVCRKD